MVGVALIVGGLLVAATPLLVACTMTVIWGGSLWSEQGNGAVLWFSIVTLPLGAALFLSGLLVVMLQRWFHS